MKKALELPIFGPCILLTVEHTRFIEKPLKEKISGYYLSPMAYKKELLLKVA